MRIIISIPTLILACLLISSCASNTANMLRSPDLFTKLANKDMSAPGEYRKGSTSYNGATGKRGSRFERYAGQDGFSGQRLDFRGARKTGNGYELNFANADLPELAKVILRDTLNIPYVYDPRVQGKVTLSTGKSISREELLFTLETVLQMNNGALVKEGGQYKVIPAAIARVGRAINVDYAREQKRIGPGYGITIFPLQFVSSDVMRNILKAFTSKQNGIKANVDGNILFIRGPGRERQTLVDVARSFDVDWMKGQSAGIYVLRNTAPEDVIPELEKIFRTNKGGAGKGVVRFQSVKRLNAILVLTENSRFLDKVAVWVRRLDRTNIEAENLFVYRVENGKAKELADILNKMFNGGPSSGSSTKSTRQVAPSQTAIKLGSSKNQPNSDAEAAQDTSSDQQQDTLTTSASYGGRSSAIGNVRIIPDEINNKLLIRASGRDYRKILKVLKRIDQAPLQVLINATLAEVTLNDSLKYGVQFYLQKGGGAKGAVSFSTGNALQVAANNFPGLNFVLGSITEPKVVLDALSSKTNVKVVSSPSVVVLHNQTASLQVGDEVPIATRQASSVNDTQAPIVNEIQFRNTGVILKVTPRVNSNGLVTMEIEQEISSVSKTNAVGESGTLTPTISQRKVSSTIAVNSGQMVVLGGLISERTNKDKSGIPGINKIPVIGDFVGADNDSGKSRTELVIFLQPTVIRNARDAADIAESVRAGLMKFAPKRKERPSPKTFETSDGWKTSGQQY